MLFKIGVFKNFARKTPVLESLFNNITGMKAWNFLKKRLQHKRFPVNITKFLRTAFFVEHPVAASD